MLCIYYMVYSSCFQCVKYYCVCVMYACMYVCTEYLIYVYVFVHMML